MDSFATDCLQLLVNRISTKTLKEVAYSIYLAVY